MRKIFVNKTLAAVLVSATFTAAAFAGALTIEESSLYANSNSSYDTFQVRPNGISLSAYELFNIAADQYTDGQSTATYNNAADFYAERGVKSLVSNWTVSEDSQIVGMYRYAELAHSVDLTNSTGTVWNIITAGQGHPFGTRETWIDSLDGSRNIDVGALGAVNMTLTGSWKVNAANDDPVWADGLSDADKQKLRNKKDGKDGDYSSTVYGDQPELNDGLISMIAYDVTDLIKAMGYSDIENAFMFTWEDRNWATQGGKDWTDFDYNDSVYIMTNVTPNFISATPEPATMLIIGLGLAGLGLARRCRKNK
ncbi:hypothetical protein FACS189454_09800 [Planctomycetales bacterium]|nr:hypothetical protein FACS189454_09800 [Planctomycetales bacterium]